MHRLRNRLIAAFLAATILPLAATIWIATSLLDRSLGYATTGELDRLSRTLEGTVRQFYQREREALKQDATGGPRRADDVLRPPIRGRMAGAGARVLGQRRSRAVRLSGPAAITSTTCGATATRRRGVLQPRPGGIHMEELPPSSRRRASSSDRSRRATSGAASR